MVSACFNQYESAGTMLMQCGAPTTSQLAKSSQLTKDENTGQLTGTVTEFLSITDHSILLVDHNGTETSWNSVFTGFGSTNWGGKGLPNADGYPTDMFFAQAYSHFVGGSKGFRGKKNYELDFGKSGALLESSSSCNI